MIIEIGSYRFPGFYESLFCNSDEFIDDEYEIKGELEELISSKNFEVSYEYDDFDKYEIDVGKTYMRNYVDKLIEVLPDNIKEDNSFLFEINEESTEITSPKYYNYETDKAWVKVKTNLKTLELIKEHGLGLDDTEKYIKQHFTSYDGFISFVSNDINIWKNTKIQDYEENMLISLLDMIISLSDCTPFEEIKYDTFYEVDKYFYASPIIYCKNMPEKDIKILKNRGLNVKILNGKMN